MNVSGTWLAHPRLAKAIEAVAGSPTAMDVLERGSRLRTKLGFAKPPGSVKELVEEAVDGTIASYRPLTNTMQLGASFGKPEGFDIPLPNGTSVHHGTSVPIDDAEALVHETVHRLQNAGGRSVAGVFGSAFAAPFEGLAALARPAAGERRAASFTRGFQHRMLRNEIEAYRVTDKAMQELGEASKFHAADGAYLGDAAVQAQIQPGYAQQNVKVATAAWALTGTLGAAAALELRPDL